MNNYGIGKWKAFTLDCGWHVANKINLSPGWDDMKIELPYLAFLLQDGEKNILIDNGINERFLIDGKAWGGAPADCGEKDIVNSLKKHGLEPSDIDIILYTHLHNDHVGNCQLFPSTVSIAQWDDWDNLLNPCPAELPRRDFDFQVIPMLKENKNIVLVEGDMEFAEGIKLIKTPGHTRGSQCIVVNTTKGIRIFVGDMFHLRCSAFPQETEMCDYRGKVHKITPAPESWPTIPSTLVYNYYDYYKSYHKVRAHTPEWKPEYLAFGHEPSHLHIPI